MKKVLVASDHAGLALKDFICSEPSLKNELEFIDLGPNNGDSVDYPDFAKKLCKELLNKKADLGILICGSGQGMAIQANRHKGIRAALCWDLVTARLSREHNNSNVLCIGGRLIPNGLALDIVKTWLATPFAGGRHQKRVDKFEEIC